MTLEFTVGGHTYRAGKLDARRQFHVTRRLAPLLAEFMTPDVAAALKGPGQGADAAIPEAQLAGMMTAVAERLGDLPDESLDYVINHCLLVVERQQATGGWARVMLSGERLMFEDLDMRGLLEITWKVLQDSLAGFFDGLRPGLSGGART